MSKARICAATGVIDGKLYTAGGYGESIGKPINNTVECFDPRNNKWQNKNKLSFEKSFVSKERKKERKLMLSIKPCISAIFVSTLLWIFRCI